MFKHLSTSSCELSRILKDTSQERKVRRSQAEISLARNNSVSIVYARSSEPCLSGSMCHQHSDNGPPFQKDMELTRGLLALGLLEMNGYLAKDPKINFHHPQCTGLLKLARAKAENTTVSLDAREVLAFVAIFDRFPRNITVDRRKVGKRITEPYLRVMKTSETKATRIVRSQAVIHSGSSLRQSLLDDVLKGNSRTSVQRALDSREDAEVGAHLNELILHLTPGMDKHWLPRRHQLSVCPIQGNSTTSLHNEWKLHCKSLQFVPMP